ncbi:MAG: ABC transporter ATP-binding protein/permease [Promicromonosporaceae bacterium]|nr:ABC transporter ATP-binding protein/permease [Promicromonosporaceae bacterium]
MELAQSVSQPARQANQPTKPESNMRTLLRFMRPYRLVITLASVLGIIATVANLWTPRIVEWVMDALLAGEPVTNYVVMFAVIQAVGFIAMLLQWGLQGRAGEYAVYDARAAIVARILKGRVPEVLSRNSGDLLSRATADAPLLYWTLDTGFVSFITATTGVVGAIILMGVIDPLMLGLTIGAVLILLVFIAIFTRRIGREQAAQQEATGEIGAKLEGSLRALRVIKVTGTEDEQAEAIMTSARLARKHGVSVVWANAFSYVGGIGGMGMLLVLVMAFGAKRVAAGYLSVPALVAFMMYVMNFVGPLMEATEGFETIQSGLAASKRIAEVETIPWEYDDGEPQPSSSSAPSSSSGRKRHDDATVTARPVLEFRNVTARFAADEGVIVENVNLKIPRVGETAITGSSGSGKSTLFALALRFIDPISGELLLDGMPYGELTPGEVRSRFAYVEQDAALVPGTVRDNLRLTKPDATDAELARIVEAVALTEDIEFLSDGFDTLLAPTTLTGSERQRVALARALLGGAEIFLFDEPASQQSGRAEQAVNDAVAGVGKSAAVLIITHRLATLQRASQVVLLDDGHVRAVGTHEELLRCCPEYREMFTGG